MKQKLFIIVILIIFSASVQAEKLSIDSFISKVLESHPQLAIFKQNSETARIKTASALSMEKWIYSLKPFINYFGEADAYQYKSSSTTRYGTEFSLKTPLGYSGGEIGLSGSTYADFNDPISAEQSEELYKQSLSVFYNQSLLKNRGLKESKLLEQEIIDDYSILQLNNMELTEKIILEFMNLYLEWAYLNENVKLMKLRVDYSDKLLSQITSRYNSNLVDAIDLLRGREALLNSRQTLLQYENRIDILVKNLKNELGIDISGDIPDFDFYKISSTEAEGISLSDIEKSRIFQINSIEEEKLKKTLRRFGYNKQPDLDLSINIGFSSRDLDLSNSLTENYPNAGISLTYSGSVNNEKNDNLISETDSRLKTVQLTAKSLAAEYRTEAESLFTQIDQNKILIAAQEELISIAAEKTEEERKYYNQGRGELNYILQSLDFETQQKIKMNDQILNLKRTGLQLKELSDNLLKNTGVGK